MIKHSAAISVGEAIEAGVNTPKPDVVLCSGATCACEKSRKEDLEPELNVVKCSAAIRVLQESVAGVEEPKPDVVRCSVAMSAREECRAEDAEPEFDVVKCTKALPADRPIGMRRGLEDLLVARDWLAVRAASTFHRGLAESA